MKPAASSGIRPVGEAKPAFVNVVCSSKAVRRLPKVAKKSLHEYASADTACKGPVFGWVQERSCLPTRRLRLQASESVGESFPDCKSASNVNGLKAEPGRASRRAAT